jgi:hypothetical protein
MGGRSGVGSRRGRGVLGIRSSGSGASGTHGGTDLFDLCVRCDEDFRVLSDGAFAPKGASLTTRYTVVFVARLEGDDELVGRFAFWTTLGGPDFGDDDGCECPLRFGVTFFTTNLEDNDDDASVSLLDFKAVLIRTGLEAIESRFWLENTAAPSKTGVEKDDRSCWAFAYRTVSLMIALEAES